MKGLSLQKAKVIATQATHTFVMLHLVSIADSNIDYKSICVFSLIEYAMAQHGTMTSFYNIVSVAKCDLSINSRLEGDHAVCHFQRTDN